MPNLPLTKTISNTHRVSTRWWRTVNNQQCCCHVRMCSEIRWGPLQTGRACCCLSVTHTVCLWEHISLWSSVSVTGASPHTKLGTTVWLEQSPSHCSEMAQIWISEQQGKGRLTLSCWVDLHNVLMAGLDLLHRGALMDWKGQRAAVRNLHNMHRSFIFPAITLQKLVCKCAQDRRNI